MFARISIYQLPADRVDDGIASFGAAVDQIRRLAGLRDVYLLVSREEERAVTITFWDTAQAMTDSRVAASRVRSDASREVEATVHSVHELEVALHVPIG